MAFTDGSNVRADVRETRIHQAIRDEGDNNMEFAAMVNS